MKRILFIISLLSMAFIIACSKGENFTPYVPSPAIIFNVTNLNHTADSVNLGDTIRLTAVGHTYDTTQNIYFYTTASFPGYVTTWGTVTSPIRLATTVSPPDATGLYVWTSTVVLPNATIAHKTNVTVAANFLYQLTLAPQLGTLSVADKGVNKATIYVR